MRLIDADALKKAIIKRLGIKSEKYLLASERSIYNIIDEQPTIEQPKEQQKITMCKDCWMSRPCADTEKRWCICFETLLEPDFYCRGGEH